MHLGYILPQNAFHFCKFYCFIDFVGSIFQAFFNYSLLMNDVVYCGEMARTIHENSGFFL